MAWFRRSLAVLALGAGMMTVPVLSGTASAATAGISTSFVGATLIGSANTTQGQAVSWNFTSVTLGTPLLGTIQVSYCLSISCLGGFAFVTLSDGKGDSMNVFTQGPDSPGWHRYIRWTGRAARDRQPDLVAKDHGIGNQPLGGTRSVRSSGVPPTRPVARFDKYLVAGASVRRMSLTA